MHIHEARRRETRRKQVRRPQVRHGIQNTGWSRFGDRGVARRLDSRSVRPTRSLLPSYFVFVIFPLLMMGVSTRSEEVREEASLPDIARRVAEGDSKAFETLFRRLSERVFRYVRGMTGEESVAHDITQDTFVRLWSSRDRLADVEWVEAYVFQTARRLVYNRTRDERVRRKNEALLNADDMDARPPAPDDEVDTDLLRELLDRWIADLPDRQREALTLRRMEGMSHDTIAGVMGISKHTVNTHIMRAMNALRERLRDHRPDLMHR